MASREQQRRRQLDLLMADFIADWRRRHHLFRNDMVPLRLIGITGFTAWELKRAGLIDIEDGRAAPIDYEWRPES